MEVPFSPEEYGEAVWLQRKRHNKETFKAGRDSVIEELARIFNQYERGLYSLGEFAEKIRELTLREVKQ